MTDQQLLRRAWDALDTFKQAYPENWHEEDQQVLDDLIKADLVADLDPYPENFIDAVKFNTAVQDLQPEPVAWMYIKKDGMQVITDDPDYADGTWTPLYPAPQKKEWEGLFNDEVISLTHREIPSWVWLLLHDFEAKLKEKNT
jgi:hypothetical protein